MKFTKNRLLSLLLVLAMLFALATTAFAGTASGEGGSSSGSGSSESGGSGSDPVAATGITLNKDTLSLAVGASETLTATLTPNGATGTVAWSSDSTNVTVANDGTVTACHVTGETPATVTATVGTGADAKTATCTVTVTQATITLPSLTLSKYFGTYCPEEVVKQTLSDLFASELAKVTAFKYADVIKLKGWTDGTNDSSKS